MSLRVGDVKRWDVLTISEQLSELGKEVEQMAKTVPDDNHDEDLYSVAYVLHSLAQALLEAAQRGGEVMIEV